MLHLTAKHATVRSTIAGWRPRIRHRIRQVDQGVVFIRECGDGRVDEGKTSAQICNLRQSLPSTGVLLRVA